LADASVEHLVFATADELAHNVADRFVTTVAAAIDEHGRAAVALTAGSIMEKVWAALVESAQSLDWSKIDVFWGDERFVPSNSPDRNDAPAEKLLFASAPFSAATRYSMPPAGGEYGEDLDAAAAGYARTLYESRRSSDEGDVPSFDVVLLGIGPDGHCCSLFPEHPGLESDQPILAVRNSPKPPPNRLSFSFDTLNASDEIWVVASGTGKADAAAKALAGDADRRHVPVSGAQGRNRTVWFLDQDAAAQL
jgi:6-phosphogluconolactonase